MTRARVWLTLCSFVALAAVILAACGGAATTEAPTVSEAPPISTQVVGATPAVTEAPAATEPPITATVAALATLTSPPVVSPTQTPAAATSIPPTEVVERRLVELEWPATMRLGESDLIRVSLIPTKDGYTVTAEFPEHEVTTQPVPVPRPGGYDLSGVARLDGVGFEIGPTGEQMQGLPLDEIVTWRWTITPRAAGQQRLSLSLKLRWTPSPGNTAGAVRETTVYDKGLNVEVSSFFGLTSGQAMAIGFVGLVVGGGLSLPLTASLIIRPRRRTLPALDPNAALAIEKPAALDLNPEETALLKVLFRRYSRLTLESEFRSGYSGARTFLALPVRADGRADAYTIAKIGERDSIQREYENYERHVKDTLPPITARIQETPVTQRGSRNAVLRYTFIGEAGKSPTSLRERLLADPDPSLLDKLFDTFGPNWWMQRKPFTFRLAQEYDRLLPAHVVLEPANEKPSTVLNGRSAPSTFNLQVGDLVALQHLRVSERRADGKSLSLVGESLPGHPPLRARWLSLAPPEGATAKVVATRETLLRDFVRGFDLHGLPDPLLKLPMLLNERVMGTQSTIHGDLNVENILVGPGGFLWLIDFAQTRDGHTLFDFAHLEAEIIAHVIAPSLPSPDDILSLLNPPILRLRSGQVSNPLISNLQTIASRCLFNPNQPREYQLALSLACLGALKFANLNPRQKHTLFLAAACTAPA